MSEKRFAIVHKEFLGYTQGYAYIIRDNSIVCEPHRWRQWSVWEDKEDVEDLCDLLNEQQTTISQLEEENKKLIEEWEFSFRTELAHHRFAEKELQEKIREKQATIQSLKEENKKLKNIHWY